MMLKNGMKNWLKLAAEASEALTEKYLEEGVLSDEEIKIGIRSQVLLNKIVPAYCGSAFKNKGVQSLLDGVIEYSTVTGR